MKQIAAGSLMMVGGLILLFAMVVGIFKAGLFSSLGAYSLVIVGLMLACFGIAVAFERRR